MFGFIQFLWGFMSNKIISAAFLVVIKASFPQASAVLILSYFAIKFCRTPYSYLLVDYLGRVKE